MFYSCGNPWPDYILLGVGVTIKFAMHTAAIILAVRTRNIEVEAVNDAKEIKITVCGYTVGKSQSISLLVWACVLYLECITFLGFICTPNQISYNP